MLEKGKITPYQAGELIFMTIFPTAVLFLPAETAASSAQDAWLAVIAGSISGFITLFLIIWLGSMYPGKTIFQYSEDILGRYAGKLVALAYVWLFLQMAFLVMRQFGEFLTTAFLPDTPMSVFNISLVFIAGLAVLSGLEVIARTNRIILILIVSFLVGVLALSTYRWDLFNLLPFFAGGLKQIAVGTISPASYYSQIIILAVFLPFLTNFRQAVWGGTAALAVTAFLLTITIIGILSTLGPEFTSVARIPIHLFVRSINVGQLLTRFEVIVMVIWVAGIFIKTSVFYYCAALGIGQIFGLSDYRPVVLSLGVIIATFSMAIFENINELSAFIATIWPLYSLAVYFIGLPLFLLIAALLRQILAGSSQGEKKNE